MKLLLIGCGKMGEALLTRAAKLASAIVVVDPAANPKNLPHVVWLKDASAIDTGFQPDVVLIAVKPQMMAAALPAYVHYSQSVFLSIAAGMTMSRIAGFLGKDIAIVRAMPNLPASIGEGMSVAIANASVKPAQRTICDQLLTTVGKTAWVEDENLIDAVTALSGSGPAYVFALCEAMAKAGEALGLTADMAAQLARQTIIGSGALLAQSPDTAETLRKNVTSPGGTTEAALKILSSALPDVIGKAMQAAAQRAKELSQ